MSPIINGISFIVFLSFVFNLNSNHVIAVELSSESESEIHESFEHPQIWSTLLEEMTINSSTTGRESRVLQSPYKYIPTSNVYINKRIDNVMPLGASAFKQNFNFNGASTGGSNQHFFNNRVPPQNGQEVSETDLYLLSAIEKLLYRVDYMERRLHKTEQLVYYLMAGNNQNQKEIQEKPCAFNFTRIGDHCYLFVANKPSNWKAATGICRSYGAHLAELETMTKNEEIIAYLVNHRRDFNINDNFWLGGLNPGLLWIWSTSARPVNPNVNLTQISNSTQSTSTATATKISPKINYNKPTTVNKKVTNGTVTITDKKPIDKKEKVIVNGGDGLEIEGNGRCLGLSYRSDKRAYKLYGLDCTSQQKFICELPQDHIDNEINRIAKKLFN